MTTLTIPATLYTSDETMSVEFDAERWFREASNQKVETLIRSDFHPPYLWEIALASESWTPAIYVFFEHLRSHVKQPGSETVYYDVALDIPAFFRWLGIHRPEVVHVAQCDHCGTMAQAVNSAGEPCCHECMERYGKQ